MIILETARVVLRSMELSDVDNLLKIFSDKETMKYYPSTKNREETIKWVEWTKENYSNHNVGLWIAQLRENNEFVGQCGIVPQQIGEKQEFEIGYLFVRKYWGQGLATECASACREYGFNKLGYERLISLIDKKNEPSIKVAERIGMEFEEEIIKWNKPVRVYSISKE